VTQRLQTGVWLYPGVDAHQLVEAVCVAEACGLDEVWIADEGVAREPMAILAAAALKTTRIKLAVGITSPLMRHPGALAATAATLDELSNGRALLGLGLGGAETLEPFGIHTARPIADMAASLEMCRAVLGRQAVSGYEPPSHAMPARQVPLWIGARGPQMIRLAARRSDGVFISGCNDSQVDSIVATVKANLDPDRTTPFGLALYHSASDEIMADSISPWERTAADIDSLVGDHHVTSIGINLVDLSLSQPVSAAALVERAAEVLSAATAQISTRAQR
jgi:5,10-methylenetetrahydromethanopterin reductase